ncbi:hypothetical protein X474_13745 [Dethiosulfatarculus sandiegensis]|uniref:Uncharacterized protein n=1 Tax=Dethiosulfatarculus sandiegensis TaxID=1429043 RepID=A0A0D2J617_9BACT|nr:hypothetical protein X474_13745 [Dethiosulfatarculus sandiegensis]
MDSYGLFPVLINRHDFNGVHGADERLLIKSF